MTLLHLESSGHWMLYSGKLTWQPEKWTLLKMYFLLNMGIFQPAILVLPESKCLQCFHDGLESFETLKVDNLITHYFSHGF